MRIREIHRQMILPLSREASQTTFVHVWRTNGVMNGRVTKSWLTSRFNYSLIYIDYCNLVLIRYFLSDDIERDYRFYRSQRFEIAFNRKYLTCKFICLFCVCSRCPRNHGVVKTTSKQISCKWWIESTVSVGW